MGEGDRREDTFDLFEITTTPPCIVHRSYQMDGSHGTALMR